MKQNPAVTPLEDMAPPPRQGWTRTFSALRYPNYRLYWVGQAVSILGWQMQNVAQSWLVYDLTRSPFYLGLVGLFIAIPTILLSLFGGVVADRLNHRRLMMTTQALSALSSLLLATLTATGLVQIWHILAIAALNGIVTAFDLPVRQSIVPQFIEDKRELMNAIALASVAWQGSRIIGPSIAGVLIATIGPAGCFYVAAAGFLTMMGALYLVKLPKGSAILNKSESVWENLTQGVGFVARHSLFSTLIGMTFFNSMFGVSYVYMMPVFAQDILKVGSQGYGFLMGAGGVGALAGTLVIASLGNFRRKGWLLLGGQGLFGTMILSFAISRWFPSSLTAILLAGAANSVYMTIVNTVLQERVPNELRGRVMGIYSLTWSMMPLGGMVGGSIATLSGSTPFAVGLGAGIVALFTLTVLIALPAVRRIS